MSRTSDTRKSLSPVKGPCQGCPVRTVGCHGTCEEYAAFRAECDALAEERQKKREYGNYIADVIKRFPGQRNI